ncbi:CHASE4 domain-containing protein [uncultured Methanolobus sp.]|uniref:CHASE4 domain-containing protein n=1 Tax=uncultured Methanolobus sp. TaxID=218300 RepID=UPI0029C64573|nr:CHASE4 domain-containing protein [uncultured Methanolobus sp.]
MATLLRKTLGIIGATLIGMIFILYLSSHFIIIDSFDKLEEQDAMKNAISLKNTLLFETHDLENKAADWSVWDETYQFIQNNSSMYIENYLMDETFLNQRLDFMFFYDNSGSLVYKKALPSGENNDQTIQELEEHLEQRLYLLEHENETIWKTGYLVFAGRPIMITSQPIVKNCKSGPIMGTVLMGRVLDHDEITRLNEITNLEIDIGHIRNYTENANDINIPESHNDENINISTLTEDANIYSYTHFNDIYGNTAFSLEISMPREIHTQGINTINYSLMVLILTGIVFAVSVTTLLERSHISRLKKLQNEVREIGHHGDFTRRVFHEGDDEVAYLGQSINRMLESLERTQDLIVKRDVTINAILQAMPDMMFLIKKDGTICNYKLSTDKCIYESPETELNITIDDVFPGHIVEMQLKVIEQALLTKKIQTMQYAMPVKGEMRDFEVRVVVSGDDEVMAIVKDITEIKQAEEMRKKDLLLKEIHHRVKNNLQVISSLLRLQSRKFTDKKTIEAFRKSQNRAKSMAIAHEKLYQSRDIENIELETYIDTLTKYLLNSYGCNPNDIKIDIKIKNITQGIDTAIPLGLIVNEIVSNALKHAFKDHKGEIQIEMFLKNNDLYMLIIRDNGIGFPEEIDFMKTDSLGMQLVVSLVEQIEGNIELIRNNGTEFRITFKELSYKRRDY